MDNIFANCETRNTPPRGGVNLLHFHQGMVLLIGADAVALYRNQQAVDDPLANGLIGYQPIPPELRCEFQQPEGYLAGQASGFIGLRSGAALFVRPDGVALYPSSLDALHNRHCCWLIPFPPSS